MDSLSAFYCLLFPTIQALFLSLTAATVTSNTQPPPRLIMKLIHHDSVISPFYNSTDSVSDLAERFMMNAIARSMFLDSKASVQTNLILDKNYSIFSVSFSIGHPPIPQIAILDTGSHLLWVQCEPCDQCFQQACPIFDPSQSSTYKEFPCDDPLCIQFRNARCDRHDTCGYGIEYMDNTTSQGTLALEQLSFQTTDEDIVVVSNVLIGCGRDNFQNIKGPWAGTFGIGNSSPNSLVNLLGNKFSYCIGRAIDHEYSYNQLALGDAVDLGGSPTPLQQRKNLYFVTLEGVSVGEERLDINPNVFKPTPYGQGGVIVDSGTIYTRIPKKEYNILKQGVHDLVSGKLTRWSRSNYIDMLCYGGKVGEEMAEFPAVTFHLAGGADLVMDIDSMFFQATPDYFCMSVVPLADRRKISIIGIMSQQNYNMGYDLDAGMVYLQRIDCAQLFY